MFRACGRYHCEYCVDDYEDYHGDAHDGNQILEDQYGACNSLTGHGYNSDIADGGHDDDNDDDW